MQQQLLNIHQRDDSTFANFHPGSNQEIVKYLQTISSQDINDLRHKQSHFVYLWGEQSVGKTHLLHACCHDLTSHGQQVFYLSLTEHRLLKPEIFTEIEQFDLVCIDDVDAIAGIAIWEEALMYLFNRIRDQQHYLIVAANHSARGIPIALSDLQSRLSSGISFHLTPLNDQEKIHALQQRAKVLGMNIGEDVLNYIVTRQSRTMSDLIKLLSLLEKQSLIHKRRITIPFVRTVLR